MKKILFVLFISGALIAFSCSKVCSCTEKNTNTTIPDIDLSNSLYSAYKNCNQLQKGFNDAAKVIGDDQNWSCK
ncbi:MAG: hypothetical protein FWH59_00105 [Lentimicrobiaceae bacterium]|nr:hypothetical protein [Lentimicrobiaceae bacterium]